MKKQTKDKPDYIQWITEFANNPDNINEMIGGVLTYLLIGNLIAFSFPMLVIVNLSGFAWLALCFMWAMRLE